MWERRIQELEASGDHLGALVAAKQAFEESSALLFWVANKTHGKTQKNVIRHRVRRFLQGHTPAIVAAFKHKEAVYEAKVSDLHDLLRSLEPAIAMAVAHTWTPEEISKFRDAMAALNPNQEKP